MKNLKIIIGSVMLLGLGACRTLPASTEKTDAAYHNLILDGKIYSAFYQQRAAEYEALCLQAYNIAKLQLDNAIARHQGEKPLAIVSDIDETFLDNSYYAVERARQGKDYDQKTWNEWTAKGIATPLTGAQEFYNYAASRGVNVFYITNRKTEERSGTMKNLKKYGFPVQGEDHLIMRSAESSKENRRQEVSRNFDIVLLLGDNLADFSKDFDHKTEAERSANVKSLKNEFGKKYIILPNFGYGDWESAFYNYNYKLTPKQKDSLMYNAAKATP